ncbi:MAG: TIGR02206 family membrane protein [Cytophagales bacterium]|nr:TIGR02206 family membrane protein [Cytophagales bacterium]
MPITPTHHVLMILFVIGTSVFVLLAGKRAKSKGTINRISRALGISMLGIWVLYNIYYFLPGIFEWGKSLPFQVCDIVIVTGSLSLIFPFKFGRSLLFFSALTLTTQAIITPTGDQDPASLRFWLYWFMHAGIIALFFYDLIIRNYQPSSRKLFIVLLADIGYVIFITPLNVIFNWNYGSMGDSLPDGNTVVDFLGPWPGRILIILAIAMAVQGSMLLFWYGYKYFAKDRALTEKAK